MVWLPSGPPNPRSPPETSYRQLVPQMMPSTCRPLGTMELQPPMQLWKGAIPTAVPEPPAAFPMGMMPVYPPSFHPMYFGATGEAQRAMPGQPLAVAFHWQGPVHHQGPAHGAPGPPFGFVGGMHPGGGVFRVGHPGAPAMLFPRVPGPRTASIATSQVIFHTADPGQLAADDHSTESVDEADFGGLSGSVEWKCPFCERGYPTMHTLKAHVRNVHNRLREYSCPHCASTYTTASNLNRHVRHHHGEGALEALKKARRASHRTDNNGFS
jgi:hypothetical protein